VWHVLAAKDHRLEHVLHPSYLSEKVRDIRAGAIVVIVHEGQQYFAELLVRAVDKDAQALAYLLLRVIDLTASELVSEDWVGASIV